MASKVVTSGFQNMQNNIRTVRRNLTNGSAIDKIGAYALEPMRQETEERAKLRRQPGRTPKGGHLDQGVVTAVMDSPYKWRRMIRVTFRGRARSIAHLVEFGTAPHWQPNRFGGIMHPGARPYPFFRPAYEAKSRETLRRVGQGLWAVAVQGLSLNTRSIRGGRAR